MSKQSEHLEFKPSKKSNIRIQQTLNYCIKVIETSAKVQLIAK